MQSDNTQNNTVAYYGYEECQALQNAETRVVLGHHAGGRVLEYATGGVNALYLDPSGEGWTAPSGDGASGNAGAGAGAAARGAAGIRYDTGGRCDIGPEHVIPRHPLLWLGAWTPERMGPRHARMTSQDDPNTGVRLTRDFELEASGTHVRFTQTMRNVSDRLGAPRVTEWCHWSRTFALHGGIGIVPLTRGTPISRFPGRYVMYAPSDTGHAIGFRPDDPHIERRTIGAGNAGGAAGAGSVGGDEFVLITGVPRHAKLGFDSYAGWLAYLLPDNRLFLKRFPSYPDRVYNEVAAITSCIYYPKERFVELEPIGPRETLEPGQEASFTEDWWLLPFPSPAARETLDLEGLVALVESTR